MEVIALKKETLEKVLGVLGELPASKVFNLLTEIVSQLPEEKPKEEDKPEVEEQPSKAKKKMKAEVM